jgi:hypothetical protein
VSSAASRADPQRSGAGERVRDEVEVEEQARALLQVVELFQQRRCAAIMTQARSQAAALLRAAYRDGRARLHQAIEEERRRAQEQIGALQAELATYQRQRAQRAAAAMLHAAWPKLRTELLRRWRTPRTREMWVDGLLHQALEVLPAGAWHIVHPADWSEGERIRAGHGLETRLAALPSFEADPAVQAGLRICQQGTCLDGTLEALLAERRTLEARLLELLQAEAS